MSPPTGSVKTHLFLRVQLDGDGPQPPWGQTPFKGIQKGPPARTRKKDSMSASVGESALKSAESQAGQQWPPMQAKNASMSASVAVSPSWLKSALPQQGRG